MNVDLRSFVVGRVLCLAAIVVVGCGGSDPADDGTGGAAVHPVATPNPSSSSGGESGEVPTTDSEAASVTGAFKAMAASEGIFFGEVPEGFPLEIIPVHPDGEIDRASIDEDGFTLLQNVNEDADSVLAYFVEHFEGLGWSAGAPFTMGDRTMVSFEGPDGGVSMTMIDQGDGKQFVALALSR